ADPPRRWEIAGRTVALDHPVIIGVVNVTPDSFSDGGRFATTDRAIAQAERLVADGCELLDVGGESTRPGAAPVPVEEEVRRVAPVIEQLAHRGLGPGVRLRQDGGAELPTARRAGNRRRLGLSCSGGAVAQAVPRGRHRAAGGGPRSGDGRGVRARLAARGALVPGARCRARARGAAGGGGDDDEPNVNFEAYHFLIPRLWPDVVEILLVAFVIYRFLLFLVGTRAMQIVVGVMILSVAYFAALLAKFQMISFLLSVVFTYGAFAVVVVFQPELRNALARLGQSRFMRRFSQSERQSVAEEIAEAMDRLSRAGTGAIIAVEGDIGLE